MDVLLHGFRLAANGCGTKTGALPSLYDGLRSCPTDATGAFAIQDIITIIANAVRILIAVSGALAVIMLLVASIYYITAMADPGRVKTAKEIIIKTVTGLVIIIISYAVITYIAVGF